MDIQKELKNWIASELKDRGRGARGKLAEHLGVRPDAITRMLNTDPDKEARLIRADELVKISEFLGAAPPGIGISDLDFLQKYNSATPETKNELKRYLKYLTEGRET